MTENKENVSPGEPLPDAVADKATEIINALMRAGQWHVDGSSIVPQGNNMWELRIRFQNGTTRRVRIGGAGGVTSDTTTQTAVLQ
ncbi:MAG TPA: hypothetical protein VKU39_21290 [Streptosporangiaceae bacterium]|nr:hypothetical protein [Streptosporangiaceae bacterium]